MLLTLVGGELKAYAEMMNDARALATKRMVEEAEKLGADAVVNIRYASAAVMQGAAEVMAYGTVPFGHRLHRLYHCRPFCRLDSGTAWMETLCAHRISYRREDRVYMQYRCPAWNF